MKKVIAIAFGLISSSQLFAQNPCQQVIANVIESSIPATVENDYSFYDICVGDILQLQAEGTYPENGEQYIQSDESSTFEWMVDNETIVGAVLEYDFAEPGVYPISLFITDTNGCGSNNSINTVVRVSGVPEINMPVEEIVMCPGDEVTIESTVTPYSVVFGGECINFVDEAMFLPDGMPDPEQGGAFSSYITSAQMFCFEENSILENADQIQQVCVNMEHSYIGDLTISLQAPNGTSVTLIPDLNGFGAGNGIGGGDMGEPDNTDGTGSPGVGYTYCWSPNADLGLINDDFEGGTLPASDPDNNTGIYSAYVNLPQEQGFQNLVGSPLNGEWSIIINDSFAIDDGYIFHWWVNIEGNSFSESGTWIAEIVEDGWDESPIITDNGDNTATISAAESGQYEVNYYATDSNGCTFEESILITIPETIAMIDLSIVPDTNELAVGSIDFTPTGGTPPYVYDWNGAFLGENSIEDVATGEYTLTITDALGCAEDFIIEVPNFIPEDPGDMSISENTSVPFEIFPQPVSNFLQIETQSEAYAIKLYHMNGQLVLSQEKNEGNIEIDLSQLESGVYLLQFQTGKSSYTKEVYVL